MSVRALTSALEAYELAIACGAPSITQADLFADLTAAHRAHVTRLDALEGFIADPEGQRLVARIHKRQEAA
ncbi:hypothetical protein [Arthrobacter agilis]|uniref:hypothetical protein n=1 Tax=Arthrobacter agilis TaxID=37921 RepID=UPI002789B1E1|nr:hypothetical protein [Arthrobacter agilis]MDQ0735157.1 hypothetical protein [Arthrobacter agilis]